MTHIYIIYVLTDMSRKEYIRLNVYVGEARMESITSVQEQVHEQVKEKYGRAAREVAESNSVQACCDPGLRCCDPITRNLYSTNQMGIIPDKAVKASLGCGNPTALTDLRPGEIVLDLGS